MKLSLIHEKPERVCAIDASTTSLAFAIFENEKLSSYGKINFQGKDVYAKIADASRKTGAVFNKFKIDAIVIEHTVYMNSPKTMADLAMVQGSLLGSAMAGGIKTVGSTNPIAWQSFIGNGKMTTADRKAIVDAHPGMSKSWYKNKERELRKEKTIKFVNTYYDVEVTDNDVADAIGIGHYAIKNWTKIFT